MSAPTRKRHLVRPVTISLAAVVVALGVYLAVSWHELRLRWLCEQLEAAPSFAEARVPLETIAAAAKDPAVGRGFLALLGPARPRATFWLFSYFLAEEDFAGLRAGKLAPERLAVLGCLGEPFAPWLEQDEVLLSLWGQFARWRMGETFWADWDQMVSDFSSAMSVGFGRRTPSGGRRRQVILRLSQERLTHPLVCFHKAEAWTLSMEGPEEDGTDSSFMDSQIERWVVSHWHRLRFDPAQGRCVLLPPDAPDDPRRFQDRGYTAPAVPWLGWKGAVPAVPELNA